MLPDDLRQKENREINSTNKKPSKGFDIKYSEPVKEKPIKMEKPSWWSRFFDKKKKKNSAQKPLPSEPSKNGFRIDEKSVKPQALEIKNDTFLSAGPPKIKSVEFKPEVKEGMDFNFKTLSGGKKEDKKPELSKINLPPVKLIEKKPKRKFSFSRLFGLKAKAPTIKSLKVAADDSKSGKTKPAKEEKMMFLDVNLIPQELAKHQELDFSKKALVFFGFGFLALLGVAFAYLGLTWYQIIVARQIQTVKDDIILLDSQISQYKDDEISAQQLQQNLKIINELLNSHIYWTKFFSLLEKYTASDVYYTNFSMAGQEKLVITAMGQDYTSAARQLLAFKQATDFVKSVRIDSAAAVVDQSGKYNGVTFNINLEFLPSVFSNPIK